MAQQPATHAVAPQHHLPADASAHLPLGDRDPLALAFFAASVAYGIVGMFIGVFLAAQLVWPALNFDLPWLSFGRLRPLHTSAVIYAFGGCALLGTMFHSVQRTCHTPLWSNKLGWAVFWGWNIAIVAVVITLPLGLTQGKEYAEPEWWIDLFIAAVWVGALVNFVMTLKQRREKHIYVSNWWYLSLLVAIAMLHVINNLALPVTLGKSYPIYSGVQDAMVQWWWGHNAVGFFLTAGFLGVMYYYLPKHAEQPVYSYRVSIVHFWSLIFIYIWAGPHHLLYSPLPEWAQTVGMIFSILLIMPSWGGSFNGLMTLKPVFHKLGSDPILRFFLAAVIFYFLVTTEGSLMSIRSVNALSHYTDWTIGHVHSGALGWVSMVTFGAIYHSWPKLTGAKLNVKLIAWHFNLAIGGTVAYVVALWVGGVKQGLELAQLNPDGTPVHSFMATLLAIQPHYLVRLAGGGAFLLGILLMAWNLFATYRAGREADRLQALAPAASAQA